MLVESAVDSLLLTRSLASQIDDAKGRNSEWSLLYRATRDGADDAEDIPPPLRRARPNCDRGTRCTHRRARRRLHARRVDIGVPKRTNTTRPRSSSTTAPTPRLSRRSRSERAIRTKQCFIAMTSGRPSAPKTSGCSLLAVSTGAAVTTMSTTSQATGTSPVSASGLPSTKSRYSPCDARQNRYRASDGARCESILSVEAVGGVE